MYHHPTVICCHHGVVSFATYGTPGQGQTSWSQEETWVWDVVCSSVPGRLPSRFVGPVLTLTFPDYTLS